MSTPESHTQTITCCSAGRGWLWWVEAFRMVKEAPGAWYLIGLGYLAILFALVIVLAILLGIGTAAGGGIGSGSGVFLVVGALLVYALIPCFIVGFVAAGWTQARGGKPKFSHLFSGFKADVKTLMGVGVATAVLIGLSFLISFFILGSDFLTEIKNFAQISAANADDPRSTEAALAFLNLLTSPRMWLALLVLLTLASLVWMAAWLAPMVVVFQRTGVVTALWNSFTGLWINWRALLIWGLVLMGWNFALSIVITVLMLIPMGIALAIGGESGMVLVQFLMWGMDLLIGPFISCLMVLSSFVAYCDIFHAKDGVFPRPAKVPKVS
ncbi:MAG: hypothetical protein FWF41_03180 [Betaproteobacteria bacterium]|nr:hypothetical protein [Betaproteobacteria bacterium]